MNNYTPQQLQAYRALQTAAERIGFNNWRAGRCKPTQAHEDLIEAMSQVLKGDITPDEAMALVWRGDVQKERGL
jgi:hypothetical protein